MGRYIQVFYEADTNYSLNWEHTAMAFGRAFPSKAPDPLFGRFFWIATIFNFIPALVAGAIRIEWTWIGLAHVLFLIRVVIAERHAAHQRATDLDHFLKLKSEQGRT